ncbi:MAG: hypothetical protein QOJ48_1926 [Frankiales bacterium]|jgi:hypothetical protein|nr:hypothetical protein [Frankiales bacterium]MCW2707743.1 hypothetical protein [Frankiales bacterium]MDX6220245.1 hypothetical protein [Frankiales bacterium]
MTSSTTVPEPRDAVDERVVALLRAHVPLSLLLDLAQDDPHSQELYTTERVTPS